MHFPSLVCYNRTRGGGGGGVGGVGVRHQTSTFLASQNSVKESMHERFYHSSGLCQQDDNSGYVGEHEVAKSTADLTKARQQLRRPR